MEADEQVERRGSVWQTLRRIASTLDRLGIRYAVLGGVAVQHYGVLRSTQGVDLLVSATDLRMIHSRLVGHGYVQKSPGSRHLRDEVTRVRLAFLVSGDYPGDGRPKPVVFPLPAGVAERDEEGISFVNSITLIELKLDSAQSAAHRMRDRAIVHELIHLLKLPADFAEQLNPYVRDEFRARGALPSPDTED